ncbi:phage terminase small subunit P27 family [Streptomyces sp. DH37]|uniref:phage terminase small subunit P27 family n=1 Tax=Streptomyces sp. DH37 TaxID=3040122 RepID=UPI00244169A9|nr:phage terminase small subunit P27 family [Streptomyces sp. DH37]MDG9703795.1 phage terminase small subunit P27 family [Streptomyces sp. DH37]
MRTACAFALVRALTGARRPCYSEVTMGRAGQGRPSKPTSLKVLHGDRKDRINDTEPVPDEGAIEPPGWLVELDRQADAGQETALDLWHRLAPDLIRKRVLTPWDTEAFAVFCDAVIGHRRAAVQLATEGLTVQGSRGVVKNPMLTALKDYTEIVVRYGSRFGLTPSDRASLSLGGEQRDPKEDLLSG